MQWFYFWEYIQMKTLTQKDLHHVHSSIIYKSQDMETTYVSINGWMDKEVWYVCTME